MRIVLTGGGTGGHLTPFEPIIESLRTMFAEKRESLPRKIENDELSINFLGIVDEQTEKFFANYDVGTTNIPSGKLRRYASYLTFTDLLFRLPFGIIKALIEMWLIMPDVVVSKGGYGSLPVVLAAVFYRIPVLLHESDARSGLANRALARFATTIAISFESAKEEFSRYSSKLFITGIPVRSSFGRIDTTAAKRAFGFKESDKVLLVIGGSQGARQLNELLLKLLPSLVLDTGIIHIAGQQNFNAVQTVARELLASSSRRDMYKVFPFLSDTIDQAYAAADVVVSRAGATTMAELARMRKACLLIPLAGAAADHQRRNAVEFELAGAARVLDPNNLGPNLFERGVRELLTDDGLRQRLSTSIALFDHPRAARDIAEIAFTLASGIVPVRKESTA